jgi:arylsulfatase A-like enzyme
VKALAEQRAQALRDTDAEVGRLLKGMVTLGLHRDTIVVLHGDGGEGWRRRGTLPSGQQLYEEHVHVPLLISWWGQLPAERTYTELVSLLDIVPTLLDLCGITAPGSRDGQSLAALLRGNTVHLSERQLYLETFLGASSAVPRRSKDLSLGTVRRAVRTPRWKFIRSEPHVLIDVQSPASVAPDVRSAGTKEELYDVLADPGEQKNVIDEEAATASALRAALDGLIAHQQDSHD